MLAKNVISSRWTLQTLHCYWAKTNCKICPENEICSKYGSNNIYGIKAVKYAMLLTLARLGKPKGGFMVAGFERAEMEYERARDAAGCTCEPKIIRAEKAYEPDGYSMEYTYNCECCGYEECEYWKEYNK